MLCFLNQVSSLAESSLGVRQVCSEAQTVRPKQTVSAETSAPLTHATSRDGNGVDFLGQFFHKCIYDRDLENTDRRI